MDKQIVDKLNKSKGTAKVLFAKQYDIQIAPYIKVFDQVMEANGVGVLEALDKIKELDVYQENKRAELLFNAAASQLIEELGT